MRPAGLSYANVMSTLGVFIALGGTSYAVARSSIGERHLKANAVTSPKIKDGSIAAGDLVPGVLVAGARGPRGAQGSAGAQGPGGPAGERGPATVIATRSDAPVNAGTAANSRRDVLTLTNVPAGNYWAIGSTNAQYGGSGINYFRCELLLNGEFVGTNVAVAMGTAGGSAIGQMIVVQEPLRIPTPSTVKLSCFHENTLDNADGRFERSRLALVRTADLQVAP